MITRTMGTMGAMFTAMSHTVIETMVTPARLVVQITQLDLATEHRASTGGD